VIGGVVRVFHGGGIAQGQVREKMRGGGVEGEGLLLLGMSLIEANPDEKDAEEENPNGYEDRHEYDFVSITEGHEVVWVGIRAAHPTATTPSAGAPCTVSHIGSWPSESHVGKGDLGCEELHGDATGCAEGGEEGGISPRVGANGLARVG
jgi:hypothetical protein